MNYSGGKREVGNQGRGRRFWQAMAALFTLALALGSGGWYALQLPQPKATWPAGLDVAWALYAVDFAALRDADAETQIGPLLELFFPILLDDAAQNALLHQSAATWLPIQRGDIRGPLLFLRTPQSWVAMLQPPWYSETTRSAISPAQFRARQADPAPPALWHCITPFGVAITPSAEVLASILDAASMPAAAVAGGLQFRWAGHGGDALAAPLALIHVETTPGLPWSARIPWNGTALPVSPLHDWLPSGAVLTAHTPTPGTLLQFVDAMLLLFTHQPHIQDLRPLLPRQALAAVLQRPTWQDVQAGPVSLAWLGLDRTDVIPWPIVAGQLHDPQSIENPWKAALRERPHIPYAWDQLQGELVPLWGDAVTAAFARRDGDWLAASRETAMQWLIDSPAPGAPAIPGALRVQGHWPALIAAAVQAGRFAAQESLLPALDEARFEQDYLPRLSALAALGDFDLVAVPAPAGDALLLEGRLAAEEAP